jgi:competence protein ComEC
LAETVEEALPEENRARPRPRFSLPEGMLPGRPFSLRRLFSEALADALDHRRHIVLLPFGLIAGVILYLGATFEPLGPASAGLALGLAGLACFARFRRARTALRWLVFLTSVAAGFALPSAHAAISGTTMLDAPTVAVIEGRVVERIQSGPDRQTVFVELIGSDAPARLAGLRIVRLIVDDAPPILPDATLSVRARLFEVPGPVAPGAYDPQIHEYFHGVGAYATALDPPVVEASGGSFASFVGWVRGVIAERIDAHLNGSAEAFAVALTIGEQGAISDEDRLAMARAGLAHVISISGLHLTLVAGLSFLLLRLLMAVGPLGSRLPTKAIAAAAGIVVALGYLFISAASVATIRSTIMLALIFAAVIAGRRALTMRNVVLAALVILALSPLEVLRPGFQLSFVAVVALIGVYEGFANRPPRESGPQPFLLRYAGGLAMTSIVAGIATAPYAAFHFQQFAPLGLLGNLLVVPLTGVLILPAGLAAILLIPFGLEGPFFALMGLGIEGMLGVAYWVSSLSGPLTVTPEVSLTALIAVTLGVAWFAFFRHPVRYAGAAAALVFFVLLGWQAPPDLIISDSSQAVAIRTTDGLRLVGSNRTSFSVEAWSQRYGAALAEFDPVGTCDDFGCIAEGVGWRLAVERDFAAAAEDCGTVDVMIARQGAPSGCAVVVIDTEFLRANGTTILTKAEGKFEVRGSFSDLQRPWRAARRP